MAIGSERPDWACGSDKARTTWVAAGLTGLLGQSDEGNAACEQQKRHA